MSNKLSRPRQNLVGKWRTKNGDPAGQYFQKPLKLVVNYLSVDARKAAPVVAANVLRRTYPALNSVAALAAARTQVFRQRTTSAGKCRKRYASSPAKNSLRII